MDEHAKTAIDGLAVTVTVGSIFGWLPAIAALFTVIWTLIRIYETATIQKILVRFKIIAEEID